jgi:hypothetical protein
MLPKEKPKPIVNIFKRTAPTGSSAGVRRSGKGGVSGGGMGGQQAGGIKGGGKRKTHTGTK